jgi:hypothetical protein
MQGWVERNQGRPKWWEFTLRLGNGAWKCDGLNLRQNSGIRADFDWVYDAVQRIEELA